MISSSLDEPLTHDSLSVDGGCVVVGGGGRVEAVDFAAVQWIVLWGQRQGLTLLEEGYKYTDVRHWEHEPM